MSFTSLLTRIDSFLRPSESPFGNLVAAANQAAPNQDAPNQADQGRLDDWKVTWRRDGAVIGGMTCAVLFGAISAFSSVPLIITIMANNGLQTSLPVAAGVQVNVPSALSGAFYKGGAWIGERFGFYVGWAAGACAAEVASLLETTSSKLFQRARALFDAAMTRLGISPTDNGDNDDEGGRAVPQQRISSAPPSPPGPPPSGGADLEICQTNQNQNSSKVLRLAHQPQVSEFQRILCHLRLIVQALALNQKATATPRWILMRVTGQEEAALFFGMTPSL